MDKRMLVTRLGLAAFALIAGFLLAMPTLLPTFEWLTMSSRAAGLPLKDVLTWSASWYDLLGLVTAQPWGDPYDIHNQFEPIMEADHRYYPFLESAFIGPVALTLAFFGLAGMRRRVRFAWVAVLLIAIAMCLGANTPMLPWLLTVAPKAALFRYPVKLLILPVWIVAYLAACGMSLLAERLGADQSDGGSQLDGAMRGVERMVALFWTVILCCGFVLSLFSISFASLPGASRLDPQQLVEARLAIGWSLVAAAFFGLLVSTLIAMGLRNKLDRQTVQIGLSVLLAASLLICAGKYITQGAPANFFEQRSYVADQVSLLYRGGHLDPPQVIQMYPVPIRALSTYHAPGSRFDRAAVSQYERQMLYGNTCSDFMIRTPFLYGAFETGDFSRIWSIIFSQSTEFHDLLPSSDVPLWRVCRLTGTEYGITHYYDLVPQPHPSSLLDPKLFELVKEEPRLDVRIYKVVGCLPRAYFSSKFQWSRSVDEVIDIIGDRASTFDPAKITLLSGVAPLPGTGLPGTSDGTKAPEPSGGTAVQVPAGSRRSQGGTNLASSEGTTITGSTEGTKVPAPTEGTVKLTAYTPQYVSIDAEVPVAGLIVLADRYYPGWRAMVDGHETAIIRANAMTRAVLVGSGRHHVEFFFDPESLYLGLKLCGAGAVLCLMLLWGAYRSKQ
jgi:hypothetical protein